MKSFFRLCSFLLTALLLSACVDGPKSVLNKAADATFIIYTFDEHGSPMGTGSGFFIDKNGIGISNYHVLDGCMKAAIRLKDGSEYEIDKVLASNKKWDIVKFSVRNDKSDKFSYLEFSDTEPEQGDRVYNLGAPLGLEQTFADGLVSSIRHDSHGQVIQVTVPISPGNSGSPIMNEEGDVVAVATFKNLGGENINFGVAIDEGKVESMKSNPFAVNNGQFNNKDGFLVLNIPSDYDENLVLNAVLFKPDTTVAYFSYTNLDLSMNGSALWCNAGKENKGLCLETQDNGRKFYAVSTDIGETREDARMVRLATVCRFQINFPPIDKKTNRIALFDEESSRWTFSDIKLADYRNTIKIDTDKYQIDFAFHALYELEKEQAKQILEEMLGNDPSNLQALNAMGIIAYNEDNYQEAIDYFTKAILKHPKSVVGYINRSRVYRQQEEWEKAVGDMSSAIKLNDGRAQLFMERADLLFHADKWAKSKADAQQAISCSDASEIDLWKAYLLKGVCEEKMGNNELARQTLHKALALAADDDVSQYVIEDFLEEFSSSDNDLPDVDSDDATPFYFTGLIGSLPVTMYLIITEDGDVMGWYYYDKKGPGKKLTLSGKSYSDGRIVLDESDEEGNNTGKFNGIYEDEGSYKGTFCANGTSKTYRFALEETYKLGEADDF